MSVNEYNELMASGLISKEGKRSKNMFANKSMQKLNSLNDNSDEDFSSVEISDGGNAFDDLDPY